MGDVIELRAGAGTKAVPAETLEEVIRRIDEALAKPPRPVLVKSGSCAGGVSVLDGPLKDNP